MPGLVKMVNGNGVGENKAEDHDWDCPECAEKFSKGLELQTHMKMVHNIEMVLQPEEMKANNPSESDWECDMCSQVFKTEGWLQRHKAKIHGANFPGALDPLLFSNGEHGLERAVSPPMLNHEEGLKALALAAGVDRIAQFHCDAPVSKTVLLVKSQECRDDSWPSGHWSRSLSFTRKRPITRHHPLIARKLGLSENSRILSRTD